MTHVFFVQRFALVTLLGGAMGCAAVVTPRLPVPLPPDRVAVGAFALAGNGVVQNGDNGDNYVLGAGGVAGATQVAIAEGFLFEVDGGAGVGGVTTSRAVVGGSLGARAYHPVGANEDVFVGADVNLTGLAELPASGSLPGLRNAGVQGELRSVFSVHIWEPMWIGTRPGWMYVLGARGDQHFIDLPLAVFWEKQDWRFGLEGGLTLGAGRYGNRSFHGGAALARCF